MPPIIVRNECELEASIAARSTVSTITEEHENRPELDHRQQQPPPPATVGVATENFLLGNNNLSPQQQEEEGLAFPNGHAPFLPSAFSGRLQHNGVCEHEEILPAAVGGTELGDTTRASKDNTGDNTHKGRRRGSRRENSQLTAATAMINVGPFHDPTTRTETRKPESSRPLRPRSGGAMDYFRSSTTQAGPGVKRNGVPYGRSPNSCNRHLRQARRSMAESKVIVLGDGTTIEVAPVGAGRGGGGGGALAPSISFFDEKADRAMRRANTQVCAANLAVRFFPLAAVDLLYARRIIYRL